MKEVLIYIFNVRSHLTYSGSKFIHYFFYLTNRPFRLLSYVGVRVSRCNNHYIDLIKHCHGHVTNFLRLAKVD